jgi:hypothetical protein
MYTSYYIYTVHVGACSVPTYYCYLLLSPEKKGGDYSTYKVYLPYAMKDTPSLSSRPAVARDREEPSGRLALVLVMTFH